MYVRLEYCNSPQISVGRVHLNPHLVVFKDHRHGPVLT